jgi:hypothetical protein
MEQSKASNKSQPSQTQLWSAAELRRVSRVFEVLINVDKRTKNRKRNEPKRNTDNTNQAA